MRKIYIFALAAALLALAGCERGMAPEGAGGITVQASIGTMTKVSYDGASTSFTAGDRIAVYAWTGSAAQVPTKRVVNGEVNTFDGTAWTPAKPMEWDGLKAAHYFLGISPVAAVTDFTADPYTLDPSKYTDSDLLIATSLEGITPSATPVDLTFTHAMAKLNVNLKFRSEFGGTPTVTGVTVKAKKTATVNYLTKAVTATGDASEVDIPAAATAATGYALGFSGLQVPQSGVTTVTVTIAGNTYVYESATDIPLESGKYTTMGLVVGKDKVELGSVEVADWTTGTDLPGGEAVKVDMLHTPLTIEALEAGAVVNFDINTDAAVNAVQYRTFDGTAWTAWANYADDDPVTLTNIGDKVQFRGNNARYATDANVTDHGSRFRFTADCLAYGNVMSLVDSEHFSTLTTLTSDYAFTFLFSSNSHLKLDDSKPLRLPATQLSKCCYEFMFTLCTGLNTLPQLPATQLASSCYSNMFWMCSGLTTIPEDYLPATTLADYCYNGMFDGCSSLTAAPILPATTLTQYCYQLMFNNCPKLSSVTCLATDISASFCLAQWLYNSGTADGCERKVYVDPSMLAVGTGNSSGEWNLADSGTDGKRWTLENFDYANLTSANIGHVLAADGNIYADAAQASAAGTEARAVIAYVGSVPNYFDKFLAIAIEDAPAAESWSVAHDGVKYYANIHPISIGGTTYFYNAPGTSRYDKVANDINVSSASRTWPVIKGWRLPSVTDWRYIFDGLGRQKAGLTLTVKEGSTVYSSNATPTDPLGVEDSMYYSKDGDTPGASSLLAAINAVCGNDDLQAGLYWSSSESSDDSGHVCKFNFWNNEFRWFGKAIEGWVRPVFAY